MLRAERGVEVFADEGPADEVVGHEVARGVDGAAVADGERPAFDGSEGFPDTNWRGNRGRFRWLDRVLGG